MEPLSIVIASAAAGGIAGKLSEQITGYVASFFARGHSDATRARAQENVDKFAEALLLRVDARLSQAVPLRPEELEIRLTDPDVAATLESAARTSARTSDSERHGILAELVAERLLAEHVTMDTVAAASAIEIVPRLAPNHVEMLGLLVAISSLRPTWWGDESSATLEEHVGWMRDIAGLYDLAMEYSRTDLLHLASAGCIHYPTKYPAFVDSWLTADVPDGFIAWNLGPAFRGTSVGELVNACWEQGLCESELLPIGSKIGWAVYEGRANATGSALDAAE